MRGYRSTDVYFYSKREIRSQQDTAYLEPKKNIPKTDNEHKNWLVHKMRQNGYGTYIHELEQRAKMDTGVGTHFTHAVDTVIISVVPIRVPVFPFQCISDTSSSTDSICLQCCCQCPCLYLHIADISDTKVSTESVRRSAETLA